MQYVEFYVSNTEGVILPNATVTVTESVGGALAALFDINGVAIGNPTNASIIGLVGFRTANGLYDIQIVSGAYTAPPIQRMQIFDLFGVAPSAGTGTLSQLLQEIGQPRTQAGIRLALDAFMLSADATLLWDDGTDSPHWSGNIPPGSRKVIKGSPAAVLRATDRTPLLQCFSAPLWVENVTAITRTLNVNLSQDPASNTGNTVDVISMSSPHALKWGDLVKVVANDIIPGSKSDSAGDRREGEFAVIGLNNTGDLTKATLTAPLRGKYTTGVRIALIPDSGLLMEGFTLDCDPSLVGTGATFSRAIRMIGMVGPRVLGMRSVGTLGAGIEYAGCFKSLTHGINFNNHPNIPSHAQFGYGVVDTSSEGSILSNSNFSYLRHPNDTGSFSCVADDPAIWKYGPNRDYLVSASSAFACQNGWSTHDEVDGAIFESCIAANFFRGAASGGAGYAMRGRNVSVLNCQDDNCRSGVGMSTIEGGIVRGHKSRRARVYGLSITGGTSTVPQDTRVKVENSSFHLTPDATGSAPMVARPTLAAVKVASGAGYTALDLLTIVGGDYVSQAQILVLTVDGGGAILTSRVEDPGYYNTPPLNPAAVTGGTGSGATFNCSFKTAYIEFGEGVEFSIETTTIDAQRGMDLAQSLVTGYGPTFDLTKLAAPGTPSGINIYWQQNYDGTLVKFDAGRGMRINAGSAVIANLWNAGVDGSDTPFTNAHQFPDTIFEGAIDIPNASTLNPIGIYAHRWPNLAWSLTKIIAGVTSRSSFMESAPSATTDLLTCVRLDRKITYRITSAATFAGLTLTNLDYTRLPRGAEIEIINASVGNIVTNGFTIPPRQSVIIRFSGSGIAVLTSKTWTYPFRIAGIRTGSYSTTTAHVGGLQLLSTSVANKVITPHANARIGDRITFEIVGTAVWGFAGGGGSSMVSPADFTSAPLFTNSAAQGSSCYIECVGNADGVSAAWVLGGQVTP